MMIYAYLVYAFESLEYKNSSNNLFKMNKKLIKIENIQL